MRFGVLLILLSLALFQSGCKQKPKDAVLDQYKAGESAIAVKNATDYRNTMTTESALRYQEIMRLALEASAEETRQLAPSILAQVLLVRNRLSAERLRKMSVDDFLVWEMDEGALVVDKEMGIVPYKVSINGDEAVIQMGEEVAKQSRRSGRFGRRGLVTGLISAAAAGTEIVPIEGLTIRYRKINGFWYYDLIADNADADSAITEAATEEKLPVPEYLRAAEEDAHGTIKQTIWEPLGK